MAIAIRVGLHFKEIANEHTHTFGSNAAESKLDLSVWRRTLVICRASCSAPFLSSSTCCSKKEISSEKEAIPEQARTGVAIAWHLPSATTLEPDE
jgi:hypothetical protein